MTWKTNMGGSLGSDSEPFQPCTGSEFRQALERYDGDSYREKIGSALDEVWPAPEYRENQRETVIDVVEQFYVDEKSVVLLSSPTGSGKSLLLYAATAVVNEVAGRKSFSSTPLNSLVMQIDNDELLDDVVTLRGRNNYECVHPKDSGTPVDNAICQRDDDFECQYKQRESLTNGCPYYSRKKVAQKSPFVVTNLSLLMSNSLIPDVVDAGFEPREMMTIDECQSVSDFALLFVGFTVSQDNIPIDWDELRFPSDSASQNEVVEWLEERVMLQVTKRIETLESKKDGFTFTQREQDQLDDLRRFNQNVANFLDDVRDNNWAMTFDDYENKIEFEPIKVGRFMDKYLWSQSNKVLCASATIPPNFTEEVGLDDRDVGRIEVPSTFPPERRPVITTEDVGKMTMKKRDQTIPKMADRIGQICDVWSGYKGIVHANSYKIAERLYDRLPRDVKDRTRLQDSDDREGSLQNWVDADVDETGQYRDEGGQLFMSVAQEEGISLDDDQARFGIVAKCSYPFLGDERISYRVNELNDWTYYSSKAIMDLQQSIGRTTRSKDDWSANYILDTSAVQLINRNTDMFESWFLDAVDIDPADDVQWPE